MVSDPRAKTMSPAQTVVAVVLQVRDGRLQVLLWERALEPFAGAWSLPGGELAERRDARAVDPPPPRGQGRRARARPPRAARDAERPRPQPAALGARDRLPRARPERRRPGAARRHALAPGRQPAGARVRPRARSCSPGASGCGRSSRTRTSASRSRPASFTISELRDLYRAALGARRLGDEPPARAACAGTCSSRTGTRREPGPAGGRPGGALRLPHAGARDHRPVRGAAPA